LLRHRKNSLVAEARELRRQGVPLIDVRSRDEYARGHADGALNIPVSEIVEGVRAQGFSPEAPLLLCCASGVRSGRAETLLKQAGYTAARNVGPYTALA